MKPGPARSVPVEDPTAALKELAGQLVSACRADPGNATLARELRMTLQALRGPADGVGGELEEFLAGFSRA